MIKNVKPILSVIVPVYNVEKYLAGCLDSLLNQTLKDIDIICVDDGSTDSSPDILKQYAKKDKRIRIVTKKNGGLSSARNAGLDVVKTELVAFVDSDDTLTPNAYEIAVSKMTDDIDLVHFGIQSVGGKDPKLQKSDEDYYGIKYSGRTALNENVLQTVDVSACNKIFRKSIMDKYGIRFPEGLRYEDAYFFNIYAMRSKYCFFIKDKFYSYIRHEGSIMSQTFSNKPGHSIDHFKIALKIYEYLSANNIFMMWRHHFAWLFFAYFGFAMRYEYTKIGQENIYNLAKNFMKHNKLSFACYPEFVALQRAIQNKTWNGETIKKLFGLIRIRTHGENTRILFAGIPILRIKYCADKTRYYPLALFCLYEKQNPLVSVLMPVYNAEKYLRESMDSILGQTYTNFEFIIINDGSTDSSADIVRSYNDPRIVFIDNAKNSGLVSVLNYGLRIARGKYIARMDSDDISLPQRFAKQIKFMERHKNVGILGTFFHMFGDGVDRIEKKRRWPKLADMLATSPVGHPTVMMRKSVMDKYNLRYDARYKHAEDYELWTRAIRYTKIANLKDVLLNYRWSEDNVSCKHEHHQWQCSEIIKQKIRRKIGKTNELTHVLLDDTQLLNFLKNLGMFSYMPNSGNMGDMLIASATMQWFDRNGLQYNRVQENENPEIFVYGGGGAWTHDYIKYMTKVMDIMKRAKQVVILPSSFNNVPEFIKILDKRFTVFCREKKSYDYLVSKKTGATILLDHDMALRMNKVPSCHKLLPQHTERRMLKKLFSKTKSLPAVVNMFRTDIESAGQYKTDFDLSDAFGWFSPYEKREKIDCVARIMLKTLMRFDTVRTDRLHVGIAAMLVGADVEFYDNSYGKISGVCNNSLTEFGNIILKQDKE